MLNKHSGKYCNVSGKWVFQRWPVSVLKVFVMFLKCAQGIVCVFCGVQSVFQKYLICFWDNIHRISWVSGKCLVNVLKMSPQHFLSVPRGFSECLGCVWWVSWKYLQDFQRIFGKVWTHVSECSISVWIFSREYPEYSVMCLENVPDYLQVLKKMCTEHFLSI